MLRRLLSWLRSRLALGKSVCQPPIDESDRAGVPSQQRDAPTAETKPNSPTRRTP